ncbi:DUF2207 domain-containing protein [Aerococcaceae bacterium WGS1372]
MQVEIAYAENILKSIDINVELAPDGSAVVTERREMSLDEGTEVYIEMNNLQDSELVSFEVKDFTYESDWDSSDSREDKAGSYGVIDKGDDKELVWGIGEYGDQTYELTYTLSNIVRNLEDGQAMLWNFDTFLSTPTEELVLTLDSPLGLSQSNTKFWAYGFRGNLQMEGEQIVWRAEESLDSSNDVTLLLQFPPEFFNASAHVDMTLEEQRAQANTGSSYAQVDDDGSSDTVIAWVLGIIATVFGLFTATVLLFYRKLRQLKTDKNAMVTANNRIKQNKDIKQSETPEHGNDIANIAYLLQELYAGNFEDYFAAYLLKWLQEEKIDIETITTKKTFSTKYTSYVHIRNFQAELDKQSLAFYKWVNNPPKESTIEEGMWLMLLDASDPQGEIDSLVMEEWGKKNADLVSDFSDYLKEYSMNYLTDQGYMTFSKEKVWGMPMVLASASPQGDILFDQITQHINYLDDLDIEKATRQGQDMTQLLIWSIIGGISTKVNKQFESILPVKEAYTESYSTDYYSYPHYWHSTMHFRHQWSSGLSSGGFSSTVISSSSGGTGGATSSGGGGGAGGGGGGGTR